MEINVTFLAYSYTVEKNSAADGIEKEAAQLHNGKEAARVLVETDSDDLQREIIQAAFEGRTFH